MKTRSTPKLHKPFTFNIFRVGNNFHLCTEIGLDSNKLVAFINNHFPSMPRGKFGICVVGDAPMENVRIHKKALQWWSDHVSGYVGGEGRPDGKFWFSEQCKQGKLVRSNL